MVLSTYTDDSEYNDEWVSYFVQYSYTLHHYYDHGYNTRFSDSESTAMEKIETYHNAVSERLMQIFGVVTYANYELIESCVDSCQEMLFDEENCYNDIEKVQQQIDCNHGTGGKNIHMVLAALRKETLWSNTLMPVVWTGYVVSPTNVAGVYFEKTIVITCNDIVTKTLLGYCNNPVATIRKKIIHTLFHEVCHSLGTIDHYCTENYEEYLPSNDPCDNNTCDVCVYRMNGVRECAMTECPQYGVEGTANEDLLCQDCIQVIRNHLADHH